MRKIITFISMFFVIVSTSYLAAAETVFHDWNEAAAGGTNYPGWTWFETGADDFSSKGWRKDDGHFYSGDSNWQPRIHEKRDYAGVSVTAEITTTDRAPSTSSGGSLRLYEDLDSTRHQICWWFIYPDGFENLGYTDANTNRLSFYLKVTEIVDPLLTTTEPLSYNVHVGTYLCSGGECKVDGGDGEGPGNRHYYHYLTINAGTWIHVLLDRTPQHLRNATPEQVPHSPIADYYQDLSSFYIEIRQPASSDTEMYIDEMKFYTESQSENEQSICSVYVGYWPDTDKWEILWNDSSYTFYNNDSISTFEIRYSTSPITNANFASATIIEPEYWEFGTSNQIRRPNSWKRPAWTRFELPDGIETDHNRIYFAIKDVSSIANGDGHNAPSSDIHTIDYVLPDMPPSVPTGLRIIDIQ